jgi:para-aminobenzoate synthetase/4-amino-4-deoxychorismate lyase
VIVLDDPQCGGERIYGGPVDVVRADTAEEVGTVLARLDAALAVGRHAAGYFAYELGYVLERRLVPLMPSRRKTPLVWFGIFDRCKLHRGDAGEIPARTHAGPLVHEWSSARHATAFERIHALIAAGDLYQANLSYRAHFAFAGEPLALYRELRAAARARHCAYVDDGDRQIVSLSPELFFEISSNRVVRTRPMKGTAARGATPEDDGAARAHLVASGKERAENLMIVDLVRNDLSRIAQPGSVEVEKLFEVETYPTVHQMVSTVTAHLRPGTGVAAVVRALFPCGSVTGAPKIRAMEIIREVETSPRGVYCGAIGHFAPDGSAAFNVAIRTLTIADGLGELALGGAVVFDSRPRAEYEECRIKARFYEAARHPLQLIETLRYESAAGFVRLERHLARIAVSAAALGVPFDADLAVETLRACVGAAPVVLRVRLTLAEDGALAAVAEPFVASSAPWRFALSRERVSSCDPLLRHKTSRRELYERERARLSATCDEVVFVNEQGELTEGSRTNLFLELEGELFTPPVASGLLGGCLRAELVEEGHAIEAPLTPADLARATRIFLGNSLRGLVPAFLTHDPGRDSLP